MHVREGFVEVEGHRLAYLAVNEHLDQAQQPAVVFIHGVLTSVNFWRAAVPPSFAESRAWFALSLPAHYPSTVPAGFGLGQVDEAWFFRLMNGALRELFHDRKVVVVGHSTGGFSALNLAIEGAPNVLGVVSVAGFHRGEWGGIEGALVKLAALGRWARPLFAMNMIVARHLPFVQRVVSATLAHDWRAFDASPLSQRVLEDTRRDIQRHDPGALFVLFNGISKLEVAGGLRNVRVPCHVFVGARDPVVPAPQSLRIASEVPGAKTVVFHEVGHMPFMEAPEAYFGALERSVAEILATRNSTAAAPSAPNTITGRERKSDMIYPDYQKDLQNIHESEVYGAAVFATAARLTRDPRRKQKWLTLKALEDQTLSRYLAYMERTRQPVTEPTGWELKGRAEGAALALMPWRVAMTLVRNATGPFQQTFQRLAEHAEGHDREFFAYVLAHEKAIEAFAQKELRKDTDSLSAVEGLLAA